MFDRIVLVGAGRSSRSVSRRLSRIAPLTLLDLSPAALEAGPSEDDADAFPVERVLGDGTSRLVLSDVRGEPTSGVALVVAPGDDRAAIECCRLARELSYAPIVAILSDRAAAAACEETGAQTLLRAEIVGQLVEQTLQRLGAGITTAGGLGRGEMLEFRVLPSSPAIGIPLAQLRAEGWRVAAIYRDDELVLPTGATTIAAEDRVVVIGDPKQLPHVAESLRVGLPTFPLLHGPNVVAYLPDGVDGDLESAAERLVAMTRALRLVRLRPRAVEATSALAAKRRDGSVERKTVVDAELEGETVAEHARSIQARNPGVVVARPRKRTVGDVVLGRGGADARLADELGVPLLFVRRPSSPERVVLCVADGAADLGVGEIALDIARVLEVPLVLALVRVPQFLEAPAAATDELLADLVRRAKLHAMQPELEKREGNPLAEWLRVLRPTDLAVVPRRPKARDSFSAPDLGLRTARKATCPVLVVTVTG